MSSSPEKSMGPIVKQYVVVAEVELPLRRIAPPAVSAPNAFVVVPVPVWTDIPAPWPTPKRLRPASPLNSVVGVALAPLAGKPPPNELVAREVYGGTALSGSRLKSK